MILLRHLLSLNEEEFRMLRAGILATYAMQPRSTRSTQWRYISGFKAGIHHLDLSRAISGSQSFRNLHSASLMALLLRAIIPVLRTV